MESERAEKIPRSMMLQIILIGISAMGIAIFFYFEGGFFNTYITHVLDLDYIFVAWMVSLSAIMGLIFVFVFGVISDNTRTKIGRRRPYFPFGIIAGIAMVMFAFSPDFWWCIVFDVLIIGVAINAYLAVHKAIIPDVIDIEYRGRTNGIIGLMETIANIVPLALTLLVYELYTEERSDGGVILNQQGHFILLLLGGLAVIICSILGFLFIREKEFGSELPPKKRFMEELRDTFNMVELKKHNEFFKFILAATIYNVATKIITIYLFNYLFNLGLETIELILGIIILGPIIIGFTLFLGKYIDKHGRKKPIAPILILSSIGGVLMPLAGTGDNINIFLLLIGAILILFGSICLMVPINTWRQDLLPPEKRGQFIGILNMTTTLNQIPAAFLAAIIADTYGVEWIFAIIPFFFLSALPLFLRVKETLPTQED